ncbi:hypothetical protein M434DRAFT_146661 [Hypoxylon sp. CO27-5]|nr:hypothetical protein M434DRAFT_146661 [Hypoxylon sp. CO27-5]
MGEIETAIHVLSEQIKTHTSKLQELVTAFSKTQNPQKRKRLRERSNAATATLFALETTYRNLLARAKGVLANAFDIETWKFSAYSRPDSTRIVTWIWGINPSSRLMKHDAAFARLGGVYYPLSIHINYFYPWFSEHLLLATPTDMDSRWPPTNVAHSSDTRVASYHGFVPNASPCGYESLWLLASVTWAIEASIKPKSTVFALISEVFDKNGHSFACERGMYRGSGAGAIFDFKSVLDEDRQDLKRLLTWLIGYNGAGWNQTVAQVVIRSSVAIQVAERLVETGLNISVEEVPNETPVFTGARKVYFRAERESFRSISPVTDLMSFDD